MKSANACLGHNPRKSYSIIRNPCLCNHLSKNVASAKCVARVRPAPPHKQRPADDGRLWDSGKYNHPAEGVSCVSPVEPVALTWTGPSRIQPLRWSVSDVDG